MRSLVEALCSAECAGRAPGTTGGEIARRTVRDALRAVGLDPFEQPIPACGGANVIATVPGDVDRWVLVAAHYDHLGVLGGQVYPGADDNAAAVAMLVELGRALVRRPPSGRGVLLAAFDAEEPPHFLTPAMGSEHFARHPTTPLAHIDQMVCLDLVGHAVGGPGAPGEVAQSLFVLGAERSDGTSEAVDAAARDEPGVIARRIDAGAIPPMSDYAAFWGRGRPFVFLTGARWSRYHTPQDVPDALAWAKIAATARWLERFVRAECARDAPFQLVERADHLSTVETVRALAAALLPAPGAAPLLELAQGLRAHVRADLTLPPERIASLAQALAFLERGLS